MIDIQVFKEKRKKEMGVARAEVKSYREEQKERAKEKAEERKILAKAEKGMEREKKEKKKEFEKRAKSVSGFLTSTPKIGKGLAGTKKKKKFKKVFKFGI